MQTDREKLIELLTAYYGVDPAYYGVDSEHLADYFVKNSVTVQKHGRWEKAKYIEAPVYVCSECGNREPLRRNYCPECGATMEG